ncbi:TIR domain-containing protein [Kitasatospora sp. NPDC048286]|uniref:TIR domain-containing protein n=1 Tax=Kitasatospora sp. NPDC048286 TaxID=3364047 RepID=UPI00371C6AC6
MARRTFFSFHYERDVWRSSIVRNSARLKPSIEAEFIDASLWEDAKLVGDAALRRLMDDGLMRTSVTAVLIGAETASRRWVRYEIDKSIERGNGLFGIYIHNIKDRFGSTDRLGLNPLPASCKTYDWVYNDGYNNLGSWVESAFQESGRI